MIRQLAPMNAALASLHPALTLFCLLALLWHGMLHAEEEPWAHPVAVAGSWRLYHPDQPAQPSLTLEMAQDYGRLQGRASDGREASGSVDGHRIRLQLRCSTADSDCREEHYDGLLQGAVINGHNSRGTFTAQIQRAFCLTFDDGPLPGATDAVLAELATLRTAAGTPVRAGFFFVAEAPSTLASRLRNYAPFELWREKGSIAAYPELTRTVLRAGHLVGNHTRHHSWAWWPWQGSESALRDEISGWEEAVRASGITDYAPIYRPPYLSRFDAQARISAALGYSAIDGRPSGDAEPGATLASVQQRSLDALEQCAESTCTLIFHDIRPVTRTQLVDVVGFLQRRGYNLVDFSPLLQPITTASH